MAEQSTGKASPSDELKKSRFEAIEQRLEKMQQDHPEVIRDRGHAIYYLKQAFDKGDLHVTKFPGVKEFLDQETGVLEPTKRMVETAGTTFRRMLGTTNIQVPPLPQEGLVAQALKQYEVSPEPPDPTRRYPGRLFVPRALPSWLGGGEPLTDVVGSVAGVGPAFGLAETAIEPAAAYVGGRVAGIPGEQLTALAREEITPRFSRVIDALREKLSSRVGGAVTTGLTRGGAGAIVGAAGEPEDRLRGAAAGAVGGLTLPILLHDLPVGLVRTVLSKPVAGMLGNAEFDRAMDMLGKLKHRTKEEVAQEYARARKNVSDVQSDLAKENQPPMDVRKLATPEEMQAFFPNTAKAPQPPQAGATAPETNVGGRPSMGPAAFGTTPQAPPVAASPSLAMTRSLPWTFKPEPIPETPSSFPYGPSARTTTGVQPVSILTGKPSLVESRSKPFPNQLRDATKFYEGEMFGWPGDEIINRAFGVPREPRPKAETRVPGAPRSEGLEAERKTTLQLAKKILKDEGGVFNFGRGGIDLDKIEKDLGITDPMLIPLLADTAPGPVFGEQFATDISSGTGPVPVWLRLPHEVFARDPLTQTMWNMNDRARRTVMLQKPPKYMKDVRKFATGLTTEESQQVFKLANTAKLEVDPKTGTGRYTQTAEGADPRLSDIAIKLRQLLDRLHRDENGYEAVVSPILRKFGMVDDAATIHRMQEIQRSVAAGQPIAAFPHEMEAAFATLGKINVNESHNLAHPYINGFYYHLPLMDAEKVLRDDIMELTRQKVVQGLANSPVVDDIQRDIENRAALIRSARKAIELRQNPRQDVSAYEKPPKKSAGDTLAFSRSLEEQLPETVEELTNRVVMRGLTNRYHNVVLNNAWKALQWLEGPHATPESREMGRYVRLFVNTVRGVKSAANNERLIRALQKTVGLISKKAASRMDEDFVREEAANLMKLRAFQALLLSPRFSVVNSFQTEQTVWPIVGTRIYLRAYAKAVGDFAEYRGLRKLQEAGNWKPTVAEANRLKNNIWVRAKMDGDLGQGERFLAEAEAMAQMRHSRILDKVVSSRMNPFVMTSEMTEQFNRVVAKAAGEFAADDPTFKHAGLLKTFVEPKKLGETPNRTYRIARRRAMGKSMIDTTQFILDKEGKPTGFTGGLLQQNIGQFRTFGHAYTELWKDAFLEAKKGNIAPFTRMTLSQLLLSGTKAIPGYRAMAGFALMHGHKMPDVSGAGLAWNALSNNTASPMNIDLTETLNGFPNVPDPSYSALIQTLAGPTGGPLLEIGEKAITTGPTSPQTTRAGLRAVLGSGFPMLEAGAELAKGGITVGQGKNAHKATLRTQDIIARGLNLAPTAKAQYWGYRKKIEQAMEGGRLDVVRDVVQEAQSYGIPFTPNDLKHIAGQVKGKSTRAKRMSATEWTDYILGK